VLTARGAALESAYPYAVVRRLFEPLGLDRDAVPTDLVTGAAALATRAFRPDAGLAGDPFATVHGLYWLTVNLSGRAPVLLAVDDCHWADEPSLRFLAYLAARLDGLPVGLLVTTRTGEPATARRCWPSSRWAASRSTRPNWSRTPPRGWSAPPSAAGRATGSAGSATGPPAATRCC
jgi:hypothetical protein